MFFHLSSHSSTSVHYTERKLKNKNRESPGNVHHEFTVMRVITPISCLTGQTLTWGVRVWSVRLSTMHVFGTGFGHC